MLNFFSLFAVGLEPPQLSVSEERHLAILTELPFVVPFEERVKVLLVVPHTHTTTRKSIAGLYEKFCCCSQNESAINKVYRHSVKNACYCIIHLTYDFESGTVLQQTLMVLRNCSTLKKALVLSTVQ